MFTNYKSVDWFKVELENAGFNLKNIIIWDKERNGMGDLSTTFGYSYEIIFFCHERSTENSRKTNTGRMEIS